MSLFDRLVPYADLNPCKNAFIDTRSPGSDKKENFTIIGPGVAENPDQHVHISIPHGFNIGGARQPAGCLNSQHSHLTEEVFVVHSGSWAFRTGVDAKDGEIILHKGDVISIPTDVFRGFENVGEGLGYLYAVLGSDDPGRVLWAPSVFELAKEHGLILLENGALVDTNLGQTVPEGLNPMPVTSQQQIEEHRVISSEQLESIILRKSQFEWSSETVLSAFDGVREAPLVGPANNAEWIGQTQLNWEHGFVVRALELQPGASIPKHIREEEEVLFVLDGNLTVTVDLTTIEMTQGDTFTTPIGAERTISNRGDTVSTIYVTRRGNAPQAPKFIQD